MLLNHVRKYIVRHALFPSDAHILVGVSGGMDSMVLLDILQACGYTLDVAHINFCLRGKESDQDATFVEDWCKRRKAAFHLDVVDAGAYSKTNTISLQVAARELRYQFFKRIAEELDICYVAVGHHADDQAETVVLNLLRGTGPDGLAGMAVRRPLFSGSSVHLVRPLLSSRRREIKKYAIGQGIEWRDDASNDDPKYRRSILRTEVLPLVKKHWGDASITNIARSGTLTRQYLEATVEPVTDIQFARVGCLDKQELDIQALLELDPVWQGRMVLEGIRRWLPGTESSEALIQEVLALLQTQTGRRVQLKDASIWKDRSSLRFVIDQNHAGQTVTPVQESIPVMIGKGWLHVEILGKSVEIEKDDPSVVIVDAQHLVFPLLVRCWQAGDRFTPLGMRGTKKISDFLTDVKIRPDRRKFTQVLLSKEQIIWVIGLRLSEHCKVTSATGRFARLTYTES